MTAYEKLKRFRSPSLFTRIFVLLLVCLTTAFAINTVRVLVVPLPEPVGYTSGELAQAFRQAIVGAPPERFDTLMVPIAPPQGEGHRERLMAAALASALDVSADRVRFADLDTRQERRGPMGPPPDDRFGPWGGDTGDRGDFRPGPPPGEMDGSMSDGLGLDFGGGPRGFDRDVMAGAYFSAGLRTPDGGWLVVRSKPAPLIDSYTRQTLVWLVAGILIMVPVAHYFARGLTEPIKKLTHAAERLGLDPNAAPVAVEGPAELGTVARALNQMQDRLRTYVQERTDMVGAIAHDLRTPLTRLAFRIESAPDDIREKAAADIAEMEAMITAALAFVRDASQPSRHEPMELRSLLESVSDDLVAMGHDITLEAGMPTVVSGDSLALRRLFTNLLTNAVKFGTRARMRMDVGADGVVVEIDDDGPGLPEHELERVFEPFYRPDRSRSRQTGGFGLGLAVARTITGAHGGNVKLANRAGGGLRATVVLPALPATRLR
ncbi:MAG: HAMP domain-containing histidine kinase [Alphaproteobacteria bacterium]|nr:MAG: HAMP domain-containing histidine kinase [Alphaproteobacteria bacterium]